MIGGEAPHIVPGGCYHGPSSLGPRSGPRLSGWASIAILLVTVAVIAIAVWHHH